METYNEQASLSERMYNQEITTWNSLSGQLQLILAILIVTLGFTWRIGEQLIIISLDTKNFTLWLFIVSMLYGFGLIDLLKTLVSFWKSWHGYEYPTMITANELHEHKKIILNQYDGFDNQNELAELGFKKVLEEKYREYATIAAKNNGNKFDNLYECKLTLLPSICFLALTYTILRVIT